MNIIRTITYYLVKVLIKIRYNLKVTGLSSLKLSSSSLGTLFLANHVALIDPVLLEYVLWKKFKPNPVAVDYLFKDKIISFLLSQVNAISVPSFSSFSEKANVHKFNETCDQVISRLRSGKNVLVYPSGQLTQNGKERIKGQSLTFKILQQVPDVQIVLIRTEGLWGSSFSKYLTGKTPHLQKVFLNALKVTLSKLFFFLPKRRINIRIEKSKKDDLAQLDKVALNEYLEGWFNRTSKENVLSLVPYK